MEKLNNKLLSYYGLILVGYNGILDMPSRLGDTFYDWGDWQQPLVDDEDIFWKSKEFSLNVVFDERRTNKTLKSIVNEISNLPECLLESKYGNFQVKVKAIQKVNSYENITKLSILFNERIPQLNATLLGPVGGNGLLIDGYDFKKDFGIVIRKVKPLDYVPITKQLSTTVFNTSQILSDHRNFKVFELDCAMAYSSASELKETTDKFKKLLSLGGYRVITFENESYNCFLTEGFKVVFVGENVIKFKLLLNITANFVDSGFVASGFVN
ncbi:hypothetical protein FORMB_16780 [Formosa sp. Hel1_33_131]|uniref:hypothetical protein n=1 Tax=Formosa sp. Hel1_33_131 TaxID=1336794 RepID=UPI00084E0C35|nr:hypothetical protein [Formosa sp. Hel1_33_131]AOR28717.1 hypothetical protein FORMB_16780 [Formosa sp. Hel1_33_131]